MTRVSHIAAQLVDPYLKVCCKRLEVSRDVLSLLHGCHDVPVHGLEGWVVGAVSEEEDAGHLDGGVALHLLEQGLKVDALGGPEVQLCHRTRCLMYICRSKETNHLFLLFEKYQIMAGS